MRSKGPAHDGPWTTNGQASKNGEKAEAAHVSERASDQYEKSGVQDHQKDRVKTEMLWTTDHHEHYDLFCIMPRAASHVAWSTH